jgi:3-phenylpropionate/trans-cinnamate dioxygenase ferredoxin component
VENVGEYIKVATRDQLPPGATLAIELPDGERVCLANSDGELYAIADRCTHRDFPMANGSVHGGATIECAWHGARFDMKTGRAIRLPAIKAIRTYTIKTEGNDILLEVPD